LYSVTFIFQKRQYDADFHALNDAVDGIAKANSGYIGKEYWQSPDGKTLAAVYYWKTLEELREFSRSPVHLEAKSRYAEWYSGYHIVVAQVMRAYGDGNLEHPTKGSIRAG
jgi:heme-degrading monooxygenase HmoA